MVEEAEDMADKSKKIAKLEAKISRLEKEINEIDEKLEELYNSEVQHTGNFWYKNRFHPEQGFATGDKYRILYELQDEGPNFVAGVEFDSIAEARKYISGDRKATYTIISPDEEIVK